MAVRDINISTRLTLGFATMAALIVAVGSVALIKMRHINDEFDSVQDDRYPKIVALYGIKGEVNDIARAMRNVFIMTEPADIRSQLDEVASSDRKIQEAFQSLEKSIVSEQGKAKLSSVSDARAKYRVARDQIVQLVQAGKLEEAKPVLLKDMRPLQLTYMERLDELIHLQDHLMKESGDEVDQAASSATAWVGTLIVASLVIAAGLAYTIVRATTRPLNRAVEAASKVAQGDLSFEIGDEGRNETGLLMDALRTMKDRLEQVVQGVRQNAEGVATASTQISQGNTDLSSRTEEQASALQQTAASMEELSSTVNLNADNASQANRLAGDASNVAARGGEVVSQVVETMKGIEESSRRISDIIQVIDSIAFQTNILALNAAVEAARAGEQGRGFAVVASEVRALAQRSAEAAKQIKQLIDTSVERVGRGTTLVGEAGATMTDVVASIQRVADIIGEISSASREQSSGVGQISDAVSQMDQVTQQNAALVEESAAAAESLMHQAKRLVDEVSFFKVAAVPTAQAV